MKKPCWLFSRLADMQYGFHEKWKLLCNNCTKIRRNCVGKSWCKVAYRILASIFVILLTIEISCITCFAGVLTAALFKFEVPTQMLGTRTHVLQAATIGSHGLYFLIGALDVGIMCLIIHFGTKVANWFTRQYRFAKLYKKHQLN